MKKYCKEIDITDIQLIQEAVYECMLTRMKRTDTLRLMRSYTDLTTSQIKDLAARKDGELYALLDNIALDIQKELIKHDIRLKPIKYRKRVDPSSGKLRNIAIQDIKQQIYDYIAVKGITPMLKRVGEYQCAAIKGRGTLYGAKHIQRWLRNLNIRYGAKADVSKCYESISHGNMMAYLRKYIKNDMLLWLIEKLLLTFDKGLSIGSYLSQHLCNLYMSQLYHKVMECMYKERKSKDGTIKRVNLVEHALFYVDDILILGTNAKDLKKAMKMIVVEAAKMGLSIKPTWITFKVKLSDRKTDRGQFIDMMGYRIYRFHMTIRRRIFRRIRKAYCKCLTRIRKRKKVSLPLARKCMSYYGYIKNTNSFKIMSKYKVQIILRICKRRIGEHESKIFRAATAG